MTDWPNDPPDRRGRRARVDRMIKQYRLAKRRRLERRASAVSKKLAARHALAQLEQPIVRIH